MPNSRNSTNTGTLTRAEILLDQLPISSRIPVTRINWSTKNRESVHGVGGGLGNLRIR